MKFNNAQEMCNYVINECRDLYCKEKELYVFLYNEAGSIAVYSIDEKQAKELQQQSEKYHDYWGAFLGPGGEIYDDPTYEDFNPELPSNLDWFKENYQGEWRDVTAIFLTDIDIK